MTTPPETPTVKQPPPRLGSIRIRTNAAEMAAFNELAALAGIKTSSWCRMILREVATERLHKIGRDIQI